MAATGPKVIQAAIVAKLNTITTANGYVTDLGNRGKAQEPDASHNPLEVLPVVIVSVPSEQKLPARSTHSHVQARIRVELDVVPDQVSGPVEPVIHDLVGDVEKLLMTEMQADPPLGVAGVDDLILNGHTKLSVDGGQLDGALYEFEVQYRHDQTDPRTFS